MMRKPAKKGESLLKKRNGYLAVLLLTGVLSACGTRGSKDVALTPTGYENIETEEETETVSDTVSEETGYGDETEERYFLKTERIMKRSGTL